MDKPANWLGPYKSADEALDALRRSVAEIIGANPETWPDHRNALLAIAATVGLGHAARNRLAERDAEIAALRADRDRLDFLDRNLEKRLGWEVGFAPAGTVCVTRIFPPNNEPIPIRAAIDAARDKEAQR